MSSHRATGTRLRALRVDRGLSPEQLGWELGASGRSYVSGPTIRRAERGAVPTPRVQYALASYFGMRLSDLWPPDGRIPQIRAFDRRATDQQQQVAA